LISNRLELDFEWFRLDPNEIYMCYATIGLEEVALGISVPIKVQFSNLENVRLKSCF
jgi:hypothetical protein